MKNEIYRKLCQDQPAQRAPDWVCVTQETNGFAVWVENHDGYSLVDFFHPHERAAAIDYCGSVARARAQEATA